MYVFTKRKYDSLPIMIAGIINAYQAKRFKKADQLSPFGNLEYVSKDCIISESVAVPECKEICLTLTRRS